MGVSLENSRVIYQALKDCGIRLVSALPETAEALKQAQALAESSLRPVALLLRRSLMWTEE